MVHTYDMERDKEKDTKTGSVHSAHNKEHWITKRHKNVQTTFWNLIFLLKLSKLNWIP